MTTARFFDGMYQPFNRRPSLVLNCTSSYAAPRFGAGTSAGATWVKTYARVVGYMTNIKTATAATPSSTRRTYRRSRPSSVRRDLHSVGIGVVAIHIVDDNFVQPQPGTGATDHLVS